jgi:hypothetical protein
MSVPNRKTTREAFAALLSTALVDTNLCQAVYEYQPADFGGQSPVVTVSALGSERARRTQRGSENTFYFSVHVFALYSDGGGWDERDAEDAIDNIEQAIAKVVDDNTTTAWASIGIDDRTTADSVEIGGNEYRRETIVIKTVVFDRK